jgi:hypothetical protein
MKKSPTILIVKQLNAILERYAEATLQGDDPSASALSNEKMAELLASSQAAVTRYAPPGSAYQDEVNFEGGVNDGYRLECLIGVIRALRADYKAGALAPIQELIRAEVFDDFLEMGEHLLEQGYKDPSAVVIGSILEQHLRKLCDREKIPTQVNGKPKKADLLNSELAAKKVYEKLDQKSVTAWLDLRNDAAHGHYDKYGAEQVKLLLLGVRDFINRTRL